MIKFIILGAAIMLIIVAVSYIIYLLVKASKTKMPLSTNEKRGLLAALAALILGSVVVYKQTKKG